MRILMSAFGFGPEEGSESGGAWRWANELAKSHDVVVVTDGHNLRRIGERVAQLKAPRLTVLYYRPWWIRRLRVTSKTSQFVFGQWQLGLAFYARGLHRQHPFDLCHHISYGVFRQASWLGFVGPPFVFGPVGGGEDAPWRLKRSLPAGEKARELARAFVNRLSTANPLWRWALSRTDLVFARTEETRAMLPRAVQARTILAQEIGAPHGRLPVAKGLEPGQPIELLFAGRLLGLKGVHFAVRSLALLRERGMDARLTVVGSGPMQAPLRALAHEREIKEHVAFVEFLPQQQLFERYAAAHVFVFPSLRDSGGNVVPEALSAGLPVVCLKLGGPPSFVNDRCGVVVPARDAADEEVIVTRLADAIQRIVASPEQWHSLHLGALARAEELSWERQIAHIQAEIQRVLGVPRAADGLLGVPER
ncbi:glycosyltransferase [Roseateles sp.]|uniref:glycosyltransferase n=1 Tax=Roseateles sp. TaxID=1971397 RepID=UPI003BA8BA9F